ncbi:hypothetical protein E2562_026730, partial [Oryza meyeriana var. granulata]
MGRSKRSRITKGTGGQGSRLGKLESVTRRMPSPLIAFSNNDRRLPSHLSNFHRKNELGGTAAL